MGVVRGRTTNLRRSIRGKGFNYHGHPTAEIIAAVKYAPFVEFGTKAHIILPRNRKMLRWIANKGKGAVAGKSIVRKGQVVGTRVKFVDKFGYQFSKGVKHPGTKPNPFFFNTIKRRYKYLPRDVRAALKRQARR